MSKYPRLEDFRDCLLSYLKDQKQFLQEDIDVSNLMSDDEKIENGLLIVNAIVQRRNGDEYELSFERNLTKVRPGDEVELVANNGAKAKATVIENQLETMVVQYDGDLQQSNYYRIVVNSVVLLDPLIKLLETIEAGQPGAFFLKLLANIAEPERSEDSSVIYDESDWSITKLNDEQKNICKAALQCPSLYCIQGPPGTGKTDVLGVIARALNLSGKNVVILAKTHHAVNNALNKIRQLCTNAPISKIGSKLKSEELSKSIRIYEKYYQYQKAYRKRMSYITKYGDVVGMTLQSAIINLGLLHTSFRPDVILVDEASQLTLAESSVLGVFGACSVIFFGDDKQMPPIFHEKQQHDNLSVSIFSHIISLYPTYEGRLCVTYRMNEEITKIVSQHFYEPYGEKIVASDFSKERKLLLNGNHPDSRINEILASEKSVVEIDVSKNYNWEDYNPEEATFIASVTEYVLSLGMNTKDIAIVTPYRRQVLSIRKELRKRLGANIPQVDTVERLQGQDVDFVIISFSVTSKEFYKNNIAFLLNKNRLNVMISRAKKKVLLVKSKQIELGL